MLGFGTRPAPICAGLACSPLSWLCGSGCTIVLKIVWVPTSEPPLLKLEGKIAGPWLEELEQVWNNIKWTAAHPIVDLTEVTLITRAARHLLARMLRHGAVLQVTPLMQATVERIKLELPET